MKIIFFGSSPFSIPFLNSIHDSSNKITLVVTRIEKGRGRGRKKTSNPVKAAAESRGIEVMEIDDFTRSEVDRILRIEHDYVVLVSFGKILPAVLVDSIVDKTINLHPSLLPRYRGPSPIITALLNGDDKTGISLIKISRNMDEGDIYIQESIVIDEQDNKDILEKKIIDKGISMLLELLDLLKKSKVKTYPQKSTGVSYTRLFTKKDLELEWKRSSSEIFNQIRAFSVSPGCFTFWKGKSLKILEAVKNIDIKNYKSQDLAGGEVIAADKNGLIVGCGDKRPISILTLQPQNKKVISYEDFINGYRIKTGDRFG